jgi:hypothetical protein
MIVHAAGTAGFRGRFPPDAAPRPALNGTPRRSECLRAIRNMVPAMIIAEQQLARLGFATEAGDRSYWRMTRLDGPRFREPAADPAESRALMRWRVLLARSPRRSPYRISRIED